MVSAPSFSAVIMVRVGFSWLIWRRGFLKAGGRMPLPFFTGLFFAFEALAFAQQ